MAKCTKCDGRGGFLGYEPGVHTVDCHACNGTGQEPLPTITIHQAAENLKEILGKTVQSIEITNRKVICCVIKMTDGTEVSFTAKELDFDVTSPQIQAATVQ